MASLDGLQAGVDNKLTFTNVNGTILANMKIEKFQWKYDNEILKKVEMNGSVHHPMLWQGVSGELVVFRTDNTLEAYFDQQSANYYTGGDQINVIITQTITNVDGSQSQHQFTNCVLNLTDGGNFSGTDTVSQTMTFMGQQRIALS